MAQDKDSYLIEPKEILELANTIAQKAEAAIGWVSDLNNVANNNLDKNLTKDAHNAFNSLWSGWYQRLLDLTEAYEGLAIVMQNGVISTLNEDTKSAQAIQDNPNTASAMGKEIESTGKTIDNTSKNKPGMKSPPSVAPNNDTGGNSGNNSGGGGGGNTGNNNNNNNNQNNNNNNNKKS